MSRLLKGDCVLLPAFIARRRVLPPMLAVVRSVGPSLRFGARTALVHGAKHMEGHREDTLTRVVPTFSGLLFP